MIKLTPKFLAALQTVSAKAAQAKQTSKAMKPRIHACGRVNTK